VAAAKNQSNYRQTITDNPWETRKISPRAAWFMALRPVSPVQLVTRALRIVWSTYHASAWFVDRYRCMAAAFGTHRAAAFATGTDSTGLTGSSVPICEPTESTVMRAAIRAKGQSSEPQSSV